jgi:hypothetical protein
MAKIKAHKSAFKKDIVIITDAIGLDIQKFEKDKMTLHIS